MTDDAGLTVQRLEERVARALMPSTFDGERHWLAADQYVARHLAAHAVDAAMLDELVLDRGFLAVADPDQLMPLLDTLAPGKAGLIARVYWRALPLLRDARPPERAAILQLTAELEDPDVAPLLLTSLASSIARWAQWSPTALHRVLGGHLDKVRAVAIGSLDKRPVIASASRDGTVRLWDAGTATPRAILRGHRGAVNAVVFGELDGRPTVISGGQDGTVKVWDLNTGECLGTSMEAAPVLEVAIAVRSNRPVILVSRERSSLVTILDARELGPSRSYVDLENHSILGSIRRFMTWEPDERVLALGSVYGDPVIVLIRTANTLIVRGIDAERSLSRLEGVSARVATIGTVRGVPVIITAGDSGAPSVWALKGGLIRNLEQRPVQLNSIGLADFGQESIIIGAGKNHRSLICWDAHTGEFLGELSGHSRQIRAIAVEVVAGQLVIASGSDDHSVRIWDARSIRSVKSTTSAPKDRVMDLAVDAFDGHPLVVSRGISGRLTLRDGRSGKAVTEVEGLAFPLRHLAIGGPKRRPLIIDVKPGAPIRVWDGRTLEPSKLLPLPRDLAAIAVGALGEEPILALASRFRLSIWRGWPLEQTTIVEVHAGWLARLFGIGQTMAVAVGQVEKQLALATVNSGRVRLWDARTGRLLTVLQDAVPQYIRGGGRGRLRPTLLAFGTIDNVPVLISVWSGTAAVWEARPGHRQILTRIEEDTSLRPMAIGAVGSRPAVAYWHAPTGGIVVRDLLTSRPLYRFPFPTSFPVVALDRNGLLVIGEERGIVAIDIAGRQPHQRVSQVG